MKLTSFSFFIATFVPFSLLLSANSVNAHKETMRFSMQPPIVVGAERLEQYLPLLKGKRVGLLVNQTSRAHGRHLVDLLLAKGIQIKAIFAPEHGFRGNKAAGETFAKEQDVKTGLPIYSLYHSHRRPNQTELKNIDILIYDIQDVGVRFYTFISSMHYLMQSCAEFGVPLIVLDRPNPNGDYVDGPILDRRFSSFLGIHPIPLVHGLTVGELARMVVGEGWLRFNFKAQKKNSRKSDLNCELNVIPVKNYSHARHYSLPIKPSTNLPNDNAIRLYPSLALFEATDVSVGRGTPWPFEVLGYPSPKMGRFSFIPGSIKGSWKHLNHAGERLYGEKVKADGAALFTLTYFLSWRDKMKNSGKQLVTRPNFLDKLTGSNQFRIMLEKGDSEQVIRASWQKDLAAFKRLRRKYLIYPE